MRQPNTPFSLRFLLSRVLSPVGSAVLERHGGHTRRFSHLLSFSGLFLSCFSPGSSVGQRNPTGTLYPRTTGTPSEGFPPQFAMMSRRTAAVTLLAGVSGLPFGLI